MFEVRIHVDLGKVRFGYSAFFPPHTLTPLSVVLVWADVVSHSKLMPTNDFFNGSWVVLKPLFILKTKLCHSFHCMVCVNVSLTTPLFVLSSLVCCVCYFSHPFHHDNFSYYLILISLSFCMD